MLSLKFIDILNFDYVPLQKSNFEGLIRDYQELVGEKAIESRKKGINRGLVLLPTGSGKTIPGIKDSLHVMDAVWTKFDGKGVLLYVVPSDQLREQAVKDFKAYRHGDNILETTVNWKKNSEINDLGKRPIIVTTYQYYRQNKDQFRQMPLRYIAIDEAHHSFAQSYDEIITEVLDDVGNRQDVLFILGMTATEIGIRGKRAKELKEKLNLEKNIVMLRDLFQNNVLIDKTDNAGYIEFIERGFLAPVKNRAALISVKSQKEDEFVSHGDFNYGKIYKNIKHEEINQTIWEAYRDKVPDTRKDKATMVTALSIEHANDLKEHFIKQGYPLDQIEVLHSDHEKYEMNKAEQKQVIRNFESGKTKILIKVGMLREGYNFAGAHNLILGAPVYSEYIYKQELGRIMRPGKDYGLVVDIVYNFGRYQSQNMHSVFGRGVLDPEGKTRKIKDKDEPTLSIDEIKWLEEMDFVNYLKPVNPQTHLILSQSSEILNILGVNLGINFSKYINNKYPLNKQPPFQKIHGNIEIIKGKSGSRDVLAVKRSDLERLVISEGFNFPKSVTKNQINPETHVIISTNGMSGELGQNRSTLFAKYFYTKYPPEKQPLSQIIHENIELIKGKSGNHSVLAVEKSKFQSLVIAEGFTPMFHINLKTHLVISAPSLSKVLGSYLGKKFAAYFYKKFKPEDQPLTKIIHQDITILRGKSAGTHDVLAVKKTDLKKLVIAEGFNFPKAIATNQINTKTYILLTREGMKNILGQRTAKKFASHLKKKYPPDSQSLSQVIHKNIELIKGKSGVQDVLGIKKEDFEKFLEAESPEIYQRHLKRKERKQKK